MTDSPTSTGIGHLNEVLDTKIHEVVEMRSRLTKQLAILYNNNQFRQRTLQKLNAIDCQQFKTTITMQLNAYHTEVLTAIRITHERYTELMGKTHISYRQQITQLQTELQKQYKLTRSMKSEVQQLKNLVESFMLEKKIKEEQIKPIIATTVVAPSTVSTIKNTNPILQIITEEDESQSTKREPEDLESPHLERPRVTIKQYITLQCFQSKLKTNASQQQLPLSPKFYVGSTQIINNEKHLIQTPPPSAAKQHPHNSNSGTQSGKKPARFFLDQFKKSFEKTLSENSIERKDCVTASPNMDTQELFSLEDSSKKFESSNSTPTDTQMLGKVTFGKEKKFFSELEESEGQGASEQLPKEVHASCQQISKSHHKSTMTKSKEKEPLSDNISETELPMKNPSYLLSHVKKKLNYNSMSNSNSNNHLKDKEREISYSSRDKTASSREDRYKLLIKNILNIKEKQNQNHSLILSREKKRDSQPLSASTCSMVSSLFVGERKIEIKYEGAKRDGRRHGRGTLYFSNGLSYQGQFRDGSRCGYGILKFNHIEIYNGDWQNDMLNGQGRVKNCSVISKKKRQATVNNNGPQLHRWISYSGEFRDNRFHGTGTLFLQNGEKFLGKFSHGMAEGESTFYKSNGEVEFGICRGNIFSQKF